MVVISPNLEYDNYGAHTFINLFSLSAPFVQLIHLPHDGLVKLCNDELMFSHTTFEIPFKIQYLG